MLRPFLRLALLAAALTALLAPAQASNDFIRQGRAGALINFNNPQDIAAAQKASRESRLGIPLLFSLDVLHGFRTVYPVPLAETATFNPALSRLASEWAAREAAYIGVQWTVAPM